MCYLHHCSLQVHIVSYPLQIQPFRWCSKQQHMPLQQHILWRPSQLNMLEVWHHLPLVHWQGRQLHKVQHWPDQPPWQVYNQHLPLCWWLLRGWYVNLHTYNPQPKLGCTSACFTCVDKATKCTGCDTMDTKRIDRSLDLNLCPCGDKYYDNGLISQCQECGPLCAKCVDKADNCLSCLGL
jgi:hypothetical protein